MKEKMIDYLLLILCMVFVAVVLIALNQIEIGHRTIGAGDMMISGMGYVVLGRICRKIASYEWRTK